MPKNKKGSKGDKGSKGSSNGSKRAMLHPSKNMEKRILEQQKQDALKNNTAPGGINRHNIAGQLRAKKYKTELDKNGNLKEKNTANISINLRNIVDTILRNKVLQDVMDIHIKSTEKLAKPTYMSILRKLGGNPSKMNIIELVRSIIIHFPINTVIENILDTQFSIRKLEKKDKDAVYFYLDKKIE